MSERYLCNGERPECKNSPWCRMNHPELAEGCIFTEDEVYAVRNENGSIDWNQTMDDIRSLIASRDEQLLL